jgi:hypothetical protein
VLPLKGYARLRDLTGPRPSPNRHLWPNLFAKSEIPPAELSSRLNRPSRRRSAPKTCRARVLRFLRPHQPGYHRPAHQGPAIDPSGPDDFLVFNQQFNTLVKAGLPILKALDLLAERAASPRLRPILGDVRQRVREGALAFRSAFRAGFVSSRLCDRDRAGERSGNLTGSPRAIHFLSARQHRFPQPPDHRPDLSRGARCGGFSGGHLRRHVRDAPVCRVSTTNWDVPLPAPTRHFAVGCHAFAQLLS